MATASDIVGILGLQFTAGSGVPTFGAPKGSLYMNTAAGSSFTRLYINTSATGASIWTAFTTLA